MYTVYKTTNSVNSKWYIGVHKTENPNDCYLGSGSAIKAAIKKYGRKNFRKEILFITEDKNDAYAKERELTETFPQKDNYNMRLGGVGGFTKENSTKGYEASLAILTKDDRIRNGKLGYKAANIDPSKSGRLGGLANKGIPKSEAQKEKLRQIWKLKKIQAGRLAV